MVGPDHPMNQEFEWNAKKADANVKKHGVAFDEALTVFADPLARIFDDPDQSGEEKREIGHSTQSRLLVVGFTEREVKIRNIHARRATKPERQDYEKNQPKP